MTGPTEPGRRFHIQTVTEVKIIANWVTQHQPPARRSLKHIKYNAKMYTWLAAKNLKNGKHQFADKMHLVWQMNLFGVTFLAIHWKMKAWHTRIFFLWIKFVFRISAQQCITIIIVPSILNWQFLKIYDMKMVQLGNCMVDGLVMENDILELSRLGHLAWMEKHTMHNNP